MTIPINDLGSGTYQGSPGYLYDGSNDRPAAYTPPTISAVNGKIGFASLGISNTQQEFETFLGLYGGNSSVNPEVVLCNGAMSGQSAEQWADPADNAWQFFANSVQQAGLTPEQVKVVWAKNSPHPNRMPPGNFPANAEGVLAWMRQTLVNLLDKYPNVEIVYHSSRIYGGYGQPSHEPIAYEHGLATKWLVDESVQGAGVPGLWSAWGPYLWADGETPRSDGLTWKKGKGKRGNGGDFEKDGIHPNTTGEAKVAGMLWDFLAADDSAEWFWA